jgi:transposase
MPYSRLASNLLLPELSLKDFRFRSEHRDGWGEGEIEVSKDRPEFEVCPRCATKATSYYDRRICTVKDAPLRGAAIKLIIHKHRWWCKTCRKPFTEPVRGVLPRRKTSQRFRKALLNACEDFCDLSRVRRTFRCSSALVYRVLYEQLELRWREFKYDWPKAVGIDEHFFRRTMGHSEFATVFTDLRNSRVKELCLGKSNSQLGLQLDNHPGRFGVEAVCMDLCSGYRKFSRQYFPNAIIVADKFHVLRLLSPAILRELRNITGKNSRRVAKKYLLTPNWKIRDYFERQALAEKLTQFPKLNELYWWAQHLHRLYRTKGALRAEVALEVTIRQMKESLIPEIQTLAKTLSSWKQEIVNYFRYRITNATTEGYNNIAKLVQRRAFGYKSFRNYRLRVLNACA